jgi:hypothetical protein
MEQWEAELPSLIPQIHRNYLPGHKKGGSVAYDTVASVAPSITGVYHSPQLLGLLRRITGAEMQECPSNDPHRCAFYAYTEEGDHMGFHYDTSYYKDRRWTLLVGFKDDSSSRLVCHLHTKNPGHEVEKLEVQMTPGHAGAVQRRQGLSRGHADEGGRDALRGLDAVRDLGRDESVHALHL